jgi:pimeloyl-ACP methyl ester carboxylesterase
MTDASNITAPTQFIETRLETYAYRRFGNGPGLPLVCLQHFTGTLDNWDPAVTDALALEREVILFESAGLGRSTGEVPGSDREWQRTRSRSWMRSASPTWICLVSLSAA